MKSLGNKTVKGLTDVVFPLGNEDIDGRASSQCSSPYDPNNSIGVSRKVFHFKLMKLIEDVGELPADSKKRILSEITAQKECYFNTLHTLQYYLLSSFSTTIVLLCRND